MRLGFFPLLGGVQEEALTDKKMCMAQYLIGQLLKRQLFMVLLFFLMVSIVICFLASVVFVQKGKEGIAKLLLMIGCVLQQLVQLHEVCYGQMQALQEQERREEHGKQSRHRIKDTISGDTFQQIRVFCIRRGYKNKNFLKSPI